MTTDIDTETPGTVSRLYALINRARPTGGVPAAVVTAALTYGWLVAAPRQPAGRHRRTRPGRRPLAWWVRTALAGVGLIVAGGVAVASGGLLGLLALGVL